MTLIVILVIIAIIAFYAMGVYNKYIHLKNLNEEGWSGVGVYLQKRLDLIPNIVNTVKGYATHEKETLENVIKMRNQMISIDANNIENVEKIQKIENQLSQTLRSIMMLQESYPDLKANTSFLSLQEELSSIESEIQSARKYYNGTARERNIFVEKFPNNILGGMFGFKKAEFFEVAEEAKKAPEVKF